MQLISILSMQSVIHSNTKYLGNGALVENFYLPILRWQKICFLIHFARLCLGLISLIKVNFFRSNGLNGPLLSLTAVSKLSRVSRKMFQSFHPASIFILQDSYRTWTPKYFSPLRETNTICANFVRVFLDHVSSRYTTLICFHDTTGWTKSTLPILNPKYF